MGTPAAQQTIATGVQLSACSAQFTAVHLKSRAVPTAAILLSHQLRNIALPVMIIRCHCHHIITVALPGFDRHQWCHPGALQVGLSADCSIHDVPLPRDTVSWAVHDHMDHPRWTVF